MLGQLVAAQFDLENLIASLGGAGAALADNQLQQLMQLQRRIGSADPAALASLRGEVTGMLAQAQQVAQQARAAASGAETADAIALATASADARSQVVATMQDMHRFDPYLQFDSAEEEAAYRKREAERRAYIDDELHKGTPEGNLNASAGALGQMADAKAHGAGNSPEFQQRWDALAASTEKLRDEVRRSGGSIHEFDNRLRIDLRAILKSKGLTDTEIDAQFAARPDPLDAMKAFVAEKDLDAIAAKLRADGASPAAGPMKETATPSPAAASVLPENINDAVSDLKAMGFAVTEHDAAAEPVHGVSGKVVAATSRTTALG
ncbi:hypothetical protein OMP43_17810 [Sphingomonas sp. CBMAI 2297]|uniref:hypothetical protein n=1 Tax=Sphingomonas sp. CBMAI 2297 TaxID=2991720 RepID=UPI00245578A6|nr:hypothetical protein [Sphingomonas sp. CBMAI 2297]MDH4745885.1 hypothetical protein [Sphingomonas sp. CBMAI 2297]